MALTLQRWEHGLVPAVGDICAVFLLSPGMDSSICFLFAGKPPAEPRPSLKSSFTTSTSDGSWFRFSSKTSSSSPSWSQFAAVPVISRYIQSHSSWKCAEFPALLWPGCWQRASEVSQGEPHVASCIFAFCPQPPWLNELPSLLFKASQSCWKGGENLQEQQTLQQ